MVRTLLSCSFVLAAAAGYLVFQSKVPETPSTGHPNSEGGLRSFEIVPLETVSETSSNASIGDLNGDGLPDTVLVKGRHWQVTSLVFFGDGKGHFTRGPAFRVKPPRAIPRRWRI